MNFWANSVKPVQKILDKGKCMETAECISFGYFWKTKAQQLQNSSWFFNHRAKRGGSLFEGCSEREMQPHPPSASREATP